MTNRRTFRGALSSCRYSCVLVWTSRSPLVRFCVAACVVPTRPARVWIAIAYPAATRSRLDGTCVYPLTYARYPGTYDQCPLLCLCRYLLFVLEECSRWIRHIPLAPRVWGVWPRTGNVRPPKPPLPLLTSRAGSATCSLLFVRSAMLVALRCRSLRLPAHPQPRRERCM